MKSVLILTLIAACAPVSLALAQKPKPKPKTQPKPQATAPKSVPMTGIYEGAITLPNTLKLRMVFRFDGKGAGTWDSPDQGARDLKLASGTATGSRVTVTCATPSWKFTGQLSPDKNSLTGNFEQGGLSMAMSLKKVAQVSALRRPQTPKPPFPYKTTEVSIANAAEAGVTLAGTLTVPPGAGPFPCVVFISGSGQQDRDSTIFEHRSFAVLADDLARRGIASLRCDDRMAGKSKGDLTKATSASFATDTEAQVAFLKTRPEIHPQKIGLIGHSEGGLIAPMLAAKPANQIAFMVLLAGTGVSGDQVLIEQGVAVVKASGMGEAVAAAARANQEKLIPIAKAEADPEKALEAMAKALGLGGAAALPDSARGELMQLTNPWMHFFLIYDPAPTLAKVTCPVLALNGDKDTQVLVGQNLPVIERHLKDAGNKEVTALSLPGLNHLFQHTKTGSPSEYSQIEETFSPDAIKTIGEWIVARTK
ncbi:alpha/beta fold hydrolase [Armatimonas sp.]|uniref:alpha/beta hydrolase family protein n=1 Tax=Armatimonas sp. TaxID=1872638 RepID=UPI00286D2FFB|nr:alpha/beta fold hydrolase [Armatimonas sp.]